MDHIKQTSKEAMDKAEKEKQVVQKLLQSVAFQHISKHSRRIQGHRFDQFSFTKRNPWQVRLERRARSKRQKQARKINR